jgi:two-component system sensor histidine kinase BaeS
VAFGDLVDEVVGRTRRKARQRHVALRVSIAPGLPKVWVDPARIRQVLDNLLANAIRHTPTPGRCSCTHPRSAPARATGRWCGAG